MIDPLLVVCAASTLIGVATYLMIGTVAESLGVAVPAGCGVGLLAHWWQGRGDQ